MARIEEKIAEITDSALRLSIAEEVANLKKHTRFGLVFEEHQPEFVPVYGKKIKRGERVAKKTGDLTVIWRVVAIKNGQALCELEIGSQGIAGDRETFPVEQLVIIRSMGEPIYPSLTPVDSVINGDPSLPHHVLIEADNYHALQLLLFPYERKVDCIYIDPPYNTGARDWKYNNDYVDDNDSWQHSKWLTFMSKRLRLAKRLLNPDSGVLIVTIDEHEVHHLGCLLEQEFPDATMQMATIVINQKGVAQGGLSRAEEYALFVFMPNANVPPAADDLLSPDRADNKRFRNPRWEWLLRGGTNSRREDRPGLFFPVHVDPATRTIVSIGEPLPLDQRPDQGTVDNTVAWPFRTDGTLGNWRVSPPTLRTLLAKGYVKLGGYDEARKTWTILYLGQKAQRQIDEGAICIVSRDATTNAVALEYVAGEQRSIKTVWHRALHDAGTYGSSFLRNILGEGGRFAFPKSIYAVRDAVAAVVRDKPNALLVDFFAGSGTTLNAVNLLNATDGGQRQCILVTNNEVSEEESRSLTAQGLQPGQDEWDRHGICRSVTWPRSKFTIRGERDDGTSLPGDYITGKQVPRDKPRNIRQLGFVEGRHLTVPQRKQVAALLPNVPQNKVDDAPWLLNDDMAVSILWDIQHASTWLEELGEADHVTEIFVVTMENRVFTRLKTEIIELLGAQVVSEDEKRPLANGFATNLEYFRLDFLDPQEIQMGRQFAAVLPVLWMMAGSRGARPAPPDEHAPWLLPDGCPFAVLMQETRFKEFVRHVDHRADLTHVFIVTNSHDTVHKLRREWPELHVVQLYKDYLENFRINLSENSTL
ncbi:site-specific DNA-methyltransferase [Noviherbaspirillum sedimenti]|uniref:Site-specific DNA-methyltransferase n=1 Tax=Noviherbaspirillum sedimenti TaxID=2320865 RepID=A0A3A3G697_9BURK|nr:DNA methyltransferase [Noviherbaspirillum sedimenti]RJG02269.1 site-specific DNA-methyltransferase [Noviherbaspirillum sedimenti]